MQQAVWEYLPGGFFFPLLTFVQCCIDIFKCNFVVFPHMKITQSLTTCIIGMTEIGHDSHLNLFQGAMEIAHAIHDRMYSIHVGACTHVYTL